MNYTITYPLGYNATAWTNNAANINQQARGQLLYYLTSLISERALLVKEAKREGLNELVDIPNGQYALAEAYSRAGFNSTNFKRRIYREQGSTAVSCAKGTGLTIALLSVLLLGCKSSNDAHNKNAVITEQTIYIDHYKTHCTTSSNQLCLRSKTDEDNEWYSGVDWIHDFQYQCQALEIEHSPNQVERSSSDKLPAANSSIMTTAFGSGAERE